MLPCLDAFAQFGRCAFSAGAVLILSACLIAFRSAGSR